MSSEQSKDERTYESQVIQHEQDFRHDQTELSELEFSARRAFEDALSAAAVLRRPVPPHQFVSRPVTKLERVQYLHMDLRRDSPKSVAQAERGRVVALAEAGCEDDHSSHSVSP